MTCRAARASPLQSGASRPHATAPAQGCLTFSRCPPPPACPAVPRPVHRLLGQQDVQLVPRRLRLQCRWQRLCEEERLSGTARWGLQGSQVCSVLRLKRDTWQVVRAIPSIPIAMPLASCRPAYPLHPARPPATMHCKMNNDTVSLASSRASHVVATYHRVSKVSKKLGYFPDTS